MQKQHDTVKTTVLPGHMSAFAFRLWVLTTNLESAFAHCRLETLHDFIFYKKISLDGLAFATCHIDLLSKDYTTNMIKKRKCSQEKMTPMAIAEHYIKNMNTFSRLCQSLQPNEFGLCSSILDIPQLSWAFRIIDNVLLVHDPGQI